MQILIFSLKKNKTNSKVTYYIYSKTMKTSSKGIPYTYTFSLRLKERMVYFHFENNIFLSLHICLVMFSEYKEKKKSQK